MNEILANISKRRVHPFPARMAPAIAWEFLSCQRKKSLRVLDPMAGSGTAIVIAKLLGHQAFGFDTDPLAVLISNAWCTQVDCEVVHRAAERVLETAKTQSRRLKLSEAYPRGSDGETQAFIRAWFDETNRRQLALLAAGIPKVRDVRVRNLLWCAFSRMIITKNAGVSLGIDISHSRPHRVHERAPLQAFDHFTESARNVLKGLSLLQSPVEKNKTVVKLGDARALPLDDDTVDLVITSPPYLNAIDYLRGHKLSLVWMGHSLASIRRIRSTNVGTERILHQSASTDSTIQVMKSMGPIEALPDKTKGMVARYVCDMDQVLGEIGRVLVRNGHAVLVVGDSSIRGVFVRNSRALELIGMHHGLKVISRLHRQLPDNKRYLPPPAHRDSGDQLSNRMRSEVIITFHNCKK